MISKCEFLRKKMDGPYQIKLSGFVIKKKLQHL